jgi:hypothetical protein
MNAIKVSFQMLSPYFISAGSQLIIVSFTSTRIQQATFGVKKGFLNLASKSNQNKTVWKKAANIVDSQKQFDHSSIVQLA